MPNNRNLSINSMTNEEVIIFIRENSPMFYLFASRYLKNHDEIEDIIQECCMKLWLNRDNINISTSAANYVFAMIKNIAYDKRRKKCCNTIEFEEIENTLSSDEDLIRNIIEAESSKIIADAIRQLSPLSQKVMNSLLDGKNNKEIAEELRLSINSIKTIKYRALNRLSKILPKHLLIALISLLINNQ